MPYTSKCINLRSNESERIPARHIFVDCETNQIPSSIDCKVTYRRLRLWCASACIRIGGKTIRKHCKTGQTRESFWKWLYGLAKPGKPIWIWAHNAAQDMTWLDLWGQFDIGNMEYYRGVMEDRPFIIWAKHLRTNIRIVDSLNWYDTSLAELGKMLGKEKLPYPGDKCSDDELSVYCWRDVEILQDSVTKLLDFVHANKLGMFRPTIGMQAMAAYCHMENKPKIQFPIETDVKEFEREAYYSGRCEVGFQGKVISMEQSNEEYNNSPVRPSPCIYGEKVYYLDFKSFYPSVMRDNWYPCKYISRSENCYPGELARIMDRFCVVAKVLINTKKTVYPKRTNGETIYPIGRYYTVLCTPELKMAYERGEIERVGAVQIYERAKLFDGYVDKIYAMRDCYHSKEDKIYDELCKQLLNSLPGKLGQKGGGWRDCPKEKAKQQWGTYYEMMNLEGLIMKCRAIAGKLQRRYPAGETLRSFPAIPGHVCSYGRVKLASALEIAGPYNTYYWDTDSLHVSERGYVMLDVEGLIKPNTLGYLDIKGKFDLAEYINSKCYVVDGQYVIAGVPKRAVTIHDWQMVTEYWQRITGILQQRPEGETCSTEIVKELSCLYDRRGVQKDGWTYPLYCSDIPELDSSSMRE